jgi:hypothetical protein
MKFLSFSLLMIWAALSLTGCDVKRDSGLWQGTVVVRDDEGGAPETCQVELDLTHTDEAVTVHSLRTSCEHFSSRWEGDTYDIQGNSLYYDGRDVGWVREDGSAIVELKQDQMRDRFPILADRVVLSWMRVDGRLEFTQEVYFAGRVTRSTGWLQRLR